MFCTSCLQKIYKLICHVNNPNYTTTAQIYIVDPIMELKDNNRGGISILKMKNIEILSDKIAEGEENKLCDDCIGLASTGRGFLVVTGKSKSRFDNRRIHNTRRKEILIHQVGDRMQNGACRSLAVETSKIEERVELHDEKDCDIPNFEFIDQNQHFESLRSLPDILRNFRNICGVDKQLDGVDQCFEGAHEIGHKCFIGKCQCWPVRKSEVVDDTRIDSCSYNKGIYVTNNCTIKKGLSNSSLCVKSSCGCRNLNLCEDNVSEKMNAIMNGEEPISQLLDDSSSIRNFSLFSTLPSCILASPTPQAIDCVGKSLCAFSSPVSLLSHAYFTFSDFQYITGKSSAVRQTELLPSIQKSDSPLDSGNLHGIEVLFFPYHYSVPLCHTLQYSDHEESTLSRLEFPFIVDNCFCSLCPIVTSQCFVSLPNKSCLEQIITTVSIRGISENFDLFCLLLEIADWESEDLLIFLNCLEAEVNQVKNLQQRNFDAYYALQNFVQESYFNILLNILHDFEIVLDMVHSFYMRLMEYNERFFDEKQNAMAGKLFFIKHQQEMKSEDIRIKLDVLGEKLYDFFGMLAVNSSYMNVIPPPCLNIFLRSDVRNFH